MATVLWCHGCQIQNRKKALKLGEKRIVVRVIRQDRPKDINRACRLLQLSCSSLNYVSVKTDHYFMERLEQLAKAHPQEGFWKFYHRLRNAGNNVNHKKLHRIYKPMGMPLRRKVKKRLPARVKEPLLVSGKFTHTEH